MNYYVQRGLVDGRYASGGLTLVAAGPPRLHQLGGRAGQVGQSASMGEESDIVYPIGITQNLNHQQNSNFMRVQELGSDRAYWIRGRTMGSLTLSRIYYDGASLLRILWAYYQDEQGDIQIPWMFHNAGADNMDNPHDVVIPPGYQNLFFNLASDLFQQPIGLLIYVRDSNRSTLGAMYLEACVVPNHSWGTDANGTIIQEQAGLQYERIVPVDVGNVALITGLNTAVSELSMAA